MSLPSLFPQGRMSQARLEVVAVFLSLAILIYAGQEALRYYRGIPIHYVTSGTMGTSYPGDVPDDFAITFARRCFTARFQIRPETVDLAHADFKRCLYPTKLDAFDVKAVKERKMVLADKMSSQAWVTKSSVTRQPNGIRVRLEGMRATSMQGVEQPPTPIQADMLLVPFQLHGEALGLAILAFDPKPELSNKEF